MTGYDIFKQAAVLMGVERDSGEYKELLPDVALCAVNRIGEDLFGNFSAAGIFDEITVPESAVSAFVYGVAMTLCAAVEKYGASEYFTRIYNAKRPAVKNSVAAVKNVIPFV